MKQEDKELLLQDLCGRLPYGVKCEVWYNDKILNIKCTGIDFYTNTVNLDIPEDDNAKVYVDNIKPYLFPLSSMTEEQYAKFIIICGWDGDISDVRRGKFSCIGYIGLDYFYDTIDWLNKNHFDYRGLIEKGLAIDATGLNIY